MISRYSNVQDEDYHQEVAKMLRIEGRKCIRFCELIGLLGEYHINFFSREELPKINRLFPTSFHSLPLHQIVACLQFVGIQKTFDITKFVVKARGLLADQEASHQIGKRRRKVESHPLDHCVKMLKNLMLRLHGKAFGGILNKNTVKLRQLHEKIHKLLKNSSHSECIQRLFGYLGNTGGDWKSDQIQQVDWQEIRKRLNPSPSSTTHLPQFDFRNQRGKTQEANSHTKQISQSQAIRITSFHSLEDSIHPTQFIRHQRSQNKECTNFRIKSYRKGPADRKRNKVNSELVKITCIDSLGKSENENENQHEHEHDNYMVMHSSSLMYGHKRSQRTESKCSKSNY